MIGNPISRRRRWGVGFAYQRFYAPSTRSNIRQDAAMLVVIDLDGARYEPAPLLLPAAAPCVE